VTFAKRLMIRCRNAPLGIDDVHHLKQELTPFQGGECPTFLEVHSGPARAVLKFGENWRLRPEEALLDRLRARFGQENIELIFR
jgi:DNA polymerase-3 subunit alpha